jgi:hypothetical protein
MKSVKVGWLILASVLAFYSVRGTRILTTHVCIAVDRFADAGTSIKQTADHLNAKHGTIAMLDEDAGATKSLIIHADLVARHEQQSMTTWDADASTLFGNVNGGVTNLRGTINATTTALNGVPPVLTATTAAVKSMNAAAGHLDVLISDPHIAGTVAHVDAAAGNVEDMSADAKAKVRSILHPKFWTQVISVTERVAVDVGKCIF